MCWTVDKLGGWKTRWTWCVISVLGTTDPCTSVIGQVTRNDPEWPRAPTVPRPFNPVMRPTCDDTPSFGTHTQEKQTPVHIPVSPSKFCDPKVTATLIPLSVTFPCPTSSTILEIARRWQRQLEPVCCHTWGTRNWGRVARLRTSRHTIRSNNIVKSQIGQQALFQAWAGQPHFCLQQAGGGGGGWNESRYSSTN